MHYKQSIINFLKRYLKIPSFCINRKELLGIFSLALALRLILFFISLNDIGLEKMAFASPDSVLYFSTARSIVTGSGFFEKGFLTFGPGYPLFLSWQILIFKINYLPMILLNIFISSFSCLLIYKLGMMITHSSSIAIIAGVLSATSYTSITLSCPLLSDSLYLFLFAMGLIFFLQGLNNQKWRSFIIAGLLFGISALCRSIGQFWLIMMLLIALVTLWRQHKYFSGKSVFWNKKYLLKPSVCAVIFLMIISGWVARNYIVNGIPAVSLSGVGGVTKITAQTLGLIQNKKYREIIKEWDQKYREVTGKGNTTPEKWYHYLNRNNIKVFNKYPLETIKTYLKLTWKNLNSISFYHRILMPKLNNKTIPLEYKIKGWYLNYLNFILSMIGIVILLASRKFLTVVILGSVYFYYMALIGFTIDQGSRIFMPGQIAWTILIAVVFVLVGQHVGKLLKHGWKRLKHIDQNL